MTQSITTLLQLLWIQQESTRVSLLANWVIILYSCLIEYTWRKWYHGFRWLSKHSRQQSKSSTFLDYPLLITYERKETSQNKRCPTNIMNERKKVPRLGIFALLNTTSLFFYWQHQKIWKIGSAISGRLHYDINAKYSDKHAVLVSEK